MFIVVCILASATAAGQEPVPAIQSAAEVDYPPFSCADDSGSATGFAVELLGAVLAVMGRDVTFQVGVWSDVREWLERGEVEVLPLVARTPERELSFDFSIPYLTMHGAIVVRESDPPITSFADLSGKSVAVMAGDSAEEFLRREPRDFAIRRTDTFATALLELAAGKHDAVVMQRLTALRLLDQLTLSTLRIVDRPVEGYQQDFCFAVPEGERGMLALLNEGLAVLMADGTFRYLHAKWFAALELPTDRPIVVGGDEGFPPFEYLNGDGEPDGFNVQLTKTIAHEMGMDVEIRLAPWAETLEAFEQREVDILQGMLYTPDRDLELDFTPAHAVNNYVAVVRKEDGSPPDTFEELREKAVVVQEGDLTHEYLLAHGLGEHVTVVPSQEVALQQLADGSHDCAIVSSVTAIDWIHFYSWDHLEVGDQPLITAEYCYAVPNGSEALLAQFTTGLKTLKASGEYRRIYEEWLGVFEPAAPGVGAFLRVGAMVVVPLLLVLLLSVAWSWSLRKQVALRTRALQRSEELQRAMIVCSPVALYSIDHRGTVQTWNDSAERVFGWTAAEIVGKPLPVVPGDKYDEHIRLREQVLRGNVLVGVEVVRQKKDGSLFDGSLSISPIRDPSGSTIGIMGAMLDISERKRAEYRLRQSEEQFRTLVEAAPDAILIQTDRRFVYVNQAGLQLLGARSEDDIVGQRVLDRFHPMDRDFVEERMRAVNEGKGAVGSAIETMLTLQGEAIPVEVAAVPFTFGGRNGALVFARDVRSRIKAERDLEESERRFRRAVVDAPFPVIIHSEDGDVLAVSRAWSEITGYGHHALRTIDNWVQLTYGDRAEDVRAAIASTYDLAGPEHEGEFEILCEDGTHRVWDFSSTPLGPLPDGRRVVISMAADVTERKRAEARVEHLNRVLRAIRDVNQLIVHERSRDTLIREGCRTLVDNRGYAYAVIILANEYEGPLTWAEAGTSASLASLPPLLDGGELPSWCRSFKSGEHVILVAQAPQRDLAPQEDVGPPDIACARLAYDGVVFGYLAVEPEPGQDVDAEERVLIADMASDLGYGLHVMAMNQAREAMEQQNRSLQSQMMQAQKMESVGRLAGGVAHDFNNFLGVIVGYAELALLRVHPEDPLHADLVEIVNAAKRSTEVTRQLLAFARKQTISPTVLDLNEVVEGMLKMLRRLIGEEIELAWMPDPVLWPVKMDPAQIDQILANLCVNARDAIAGVGKVVIETHNVTLDEPDCLERTDMRPGSYVMLIVSDDGIGMDKSTLGSIFEPFFTTKEAHRGTGLGLATVYGIVQQNGGFINVYSEAGNGTTFKMYIPRHAGEAPKPVEQRPLIPRSRGEAVLLVEDELSIMHMGRAMLEKLGYRVVAVVSPHEALQHVREHSSDIDLLITDVVMPEMNGRELADALRELDGKLKLLYMSGYTADVIAQRGVLDEGVQFIPKPFTMTELAVKVRSVLDQA